MFAREKGDNFVEKNTYRRRFFMFKYLNFPRYQEYEEYEKLYSKAFEESEEATSLMREHFMNGMKILNQIKATDENLRNTEMLSSDTLDDLCKIAASNLLVLMKIQTRPQDKKVKVVIDIQSNEWLPKVDVEFK